MPASINDSFQSGISLFTIIKHIDHIALEKQRDVLFLLFDPAIGDYTCNPARQTILQWLDEHHIGWEPCASIYRPNIISEYQGMIYIDIPFDESNPRYCLLQHFLEHPDGKGRFPDVVFSFLRLENPPTHF